MRMRAGKVSEVDRKTLAIMLSLLTAALCRKTKKINGGKSKMKLKRILALAVSLAMVLSIVPAFGLTASAATEYPLSAYVNKADVVWSTPSGEYYDRPVSEVFEDWTSTVTGNGSNVNVRTYTEGVTLQFYPTVYNNGTNLAEVKTPEGGYGTGKTYTVLSWVFNRDDVGGNDGLYHDYTILDASYDTIAYLKLDKNHTEVDDTYRMGYPGNGAQMAMVWYNNEGGTSYTVDYYVNGEKTFTKVYNEGETVKDGNGDGGEDLMMTAPASVEGFGGIKARMCKWNTSSKHIGFANLSVAAGDVADLSNDDIIVEELADALTLDDSIISADIELPTEVTSDDYKGNVTWKSSNPEAVDENGTYGEPEGITSVVFTATVTYNESTAEKVFPARIVAAASRANSTFMLDGKTLKTTGENLIENGDFKSSYEGWTNAKDGGLIAEANWEITDKYAVNGKAIYNKYTNGEGGNGASTIRRFVTLDPGTYYVSYYVYNEKSTAQGNMSATVPVTGGSIFGTFDGLTFKDYVEYGGHNSWSHETQSEVDRPRSDKMFQPGLTKVEYFMTIPEDASLMISYGAWTEPALYLSNFEIYAAEQQTKTITINYKSNDDATFASETVTVDAGASVTTYSVTEGKLVKSEEGKYYYVEDNKDDVVGDIVFDVAEDNTVTVPVVALGNTFLIQNGKINVGKITDNGSHYAYNTFGAMNWGTEGSTDRIGVAVIDIDDVTKAHYAIDATQVRWHVGNATNGVKFYAISLKDFNSIDLTNVDELKAKLVDDNKVAQIHKDSGNDQTPQSVQITLDMDAEKAAALAGESGKIVILGNSFNTLYGLADMKLTAGYTVTIDEGTATVYAPGVAEIAAAGSAYKDQTGKLYAVKDGKITIDVEEDTTLTSVSLGVELVSGAQIRVGKSSSGKVAEDSGLRFIGVITAEEGNVIGEEGAELFVRIAPEDSPENSTDIAIEKYQSGNKEEGGIFTAVLTNLSPANYNRVFTATPVVKIGKEEFVGKSVLRSVYEIAAGILVEGKADTTDGLGEYDIVTDVLNAYVNAVGVRFTWDKTEKTVKDEESANYYKYGNQEKKTVFFTVKSDAGDVDGTYTITVTPAAESVVIDADTFKNSVRVNNNNGNAKEYISNVQATEDGGVTFTFTPPAVPAE